MGNTLIIVQARMGGTRYPGKVLASLGGQPMLLWQLLRLTQVPEANLVVAMPRTEENLPLIDLCERHGYAWYAPDCPEEDVLGRYYLTAKDCHAEMVVRVTGDCPLLDPLVVRGALEYARSFQASELYHVGISEQWPDGQDVEVFSMAALAWAYEQAVDYADREHVTPYMWRHHDEVACAKIPCPFDLSWQQYSVDTPEDLRVTSLILAACRVRYGLMFGWGEIDQIIREDEALVAAIAQRPPRNHKYVEQLGAESWRVVRYGG